MYLLGFMRLYRIPHSKVKPYHGQRQDLARAIESWCQRVNGEALVLVPC